MRLIAKGCVLLDRSLMWAAGICLVFIFVAIIYDVVLRNLGLQPPGFTLAVTEYGMFFITMAVAPLLVRIGGHVSVEIFSSALSPVHRRVLATCVHLACATLCFLLAWFAFSAAHDAAARGEIDIRSIDLPRWVLYAILGGGLFLSGLEFVLLMVTKIDLPRDELPMGSI